MEIRLDIQRMQREIREQKGKREVLNNMELFVLDNSLRESTVGQLRGHTIENKWKIYEQVRGPRGLSPKLACNFVRIIACLVNLFLSNFRLRNRAHWLQPKRLLSASNS